MPPVSDWIARFAPLVPQGGRVLDLACGSGRHARLFLERGHPVTAVDRDLSGVADLSGTAELIAADLEATDPLLDAGCWPKALRGRDFAGVVVTNYLWRPLLPAIVDAIAPDGLLLYETFGQGQQAFGKPSNPAFLLHPGELLDAVRGRLQVVAHEHGIEDGRRVVSRVCAARNGPLPLKIGG